MCNTCGIPGHYKRDCELIREEQARARREQEDEEEDRARRKEERRRQTLTPEELAHERRVEKLKALSYNQAQAVAALDACNNELDRAAEWLINGGAAGLEDFVSVGKGGKAKLKPPV